MARLVADRSWGQNWRDPEYYLKWCVYTLPGIARGLDEVFELIINVPALVQPITLTAKVIHATMNDPEDKTMPCEMGILFTEISEKQRWLISTAIQRESGVMLMP